MKTYFKYIIIGWSMVSIGVVMVTYQIARRMFLIKGYSIFVSPTPKVMEKQKGDKERGKREEIQSALLNSLGCELYDDGEFFN